MVVDDDPELRWMCRQLLEAEGHAVVEAPDGREALLYLMNQEQAQPCLILLDLSMPVMDGWEFLAIIKSYVRLHEVPVVLISALEPSLDPIRHGTIAAYLRKPCDPKEVVKLAARYAAC